ncbi:MAG: cytochrome b559 subunit alpha [Cyanobacteria bacterium J06558_2]
MAGRTGERPLGDIITDVEFWKLHFINIPAIFISGFLFVSTGLAYDAFGTPRPNEYFQGASLEMPIVTDRRNVKGQLDQLIDERQKDAPEIDSP